MKDLIKTTFLGILVIALLTPMTAHGLVITYKFDYEFSEAEQPGGPTPWLTATFNDELEGLLENQVLLTLSADNLTERETITQLYFNFDPDHNPSLLDFTIVDNSASPPNGIYTGYDAFRADGDGWFDVLIDFPPPSALGDPDQYFTTGEQIIYIISSNDPEVYSIDSSSFDFESEGGDKGGFNAAAKIQRIDDDDYSGWIAPHCIPEPATVLLLGSLLIGIGGIKRKLQ